MTTPALRFGSLVHKALELRYPPGVKRGPHPAESFERLFTENIDEVEHTFNIRVDEEWMDAGELGVKMLNAFIDHYGKDEEYRVIAPEQTFKVPVFNPEAPRRILFYYVGTLDLVWEYRPTKRIRINDWKTVASSTNVERAGEEYVLNDQASSYWTFGVDWLRRQRLLGPADLAKLDGMTFSFLRKALPDERPTNSAGQRLNQNGSVSKNQPSPLFGRATIYRTEAERARTRERAIEEFREMEAARAGRLAIYKTPGTPPNSHCNWCGYRDICELHETGADWRALRDGTMVEWDPYSDHEIHEEATRR